MRRLVGFEYVLDGFRSRVPRKRGNDRTFKFFDTWALEYHGNPILRVNPASGITEICTCGWGSSPSTKTRLNIILATLGSSARIYTRDFTTYIDYSCYGNGIHEMHGNAWYSLHGTEQRITPADLLI